MPVFNTAAHMRPAKIVDAMYEGQQARQAIQSNAEKIKTQQIQNEAMPGQIAEEVAASATRRKTAMAENERAEQQALFEWQMKTAPAMVRAYEQSPEVANQLYRQLQSSAPPAYHRMLAEQGGVDLFDEDDYQMAKQLIGPSQSQIGQVQPSNWQPDSLQRFAETGNYGELSPVASADGAKPLVKTITVTDPETGDDVEKLVSFDPVTLQPIGERELSRSTDPSKQNVADAVDITTEFLETEGAIEAVYGNIKGNVPTFFGEAKDLNIKRKQLVNLLTLAMRGQLKGQGTVSDFEAKMLAKAATILDERTISPSAARDAMQALHDTLRGKYKDISSGTESAAEIEARVFGEDASAVIQRNSFRRQRITPERERELTNPDNW